MWINISIYSLFGGFQNISNKTYTIETLPDSSKNWHFKHDISKLPTINCYDIIKLQSGPDWTK